MHMSVNDKRLGTCVTHLFQHLRHKAGYLIAVEIKLYFAM